MRPKHIGGCWYASASILLWNMQKWFRIYMALSDPDLVELLTQCCLLLLGVIGRTVLRAEDRVYPVLAKSHLLLA